MTTILALETSSEACSVALKLPNEIVELHHILPRQQSQHILPMIEELLAKCGMNQQAIDIIAFGCGPGSFTGVRIAASITQGLALALDKPVARVSTLAALAQYAIRKRDAEHILACIDARMGEVYWGAFIHDKFHQIVQPITEEHLTAPEKVCLEQYHDQKKLIFDQKNCWFGIGTGWNYANSINFNRDTIQIIDTSLSPHAEDIAILADHLAKHNNLCKPEQAIPTYIRNNVTFHKKS